MVRRSFLSYVLLLVVALVLISATPVVAVSTVDCHCFRDREFSAGNPAAFDPYLLTTVQNRLLAYAFKIPRKEIVSLKMSGAEGDGLWMAFWVAHVSKKSVSQVLDLHAELRSWPKVVESLNMTSETLGLDLWKLLPAAEDNFLAWAVASKISGAFLGSPAQDFALLNDKVATLKEAIFAAVLSGMLAVPVEQVLLQEKGRGSWGSLLISAGLTANDVDTFLVEKFPAQ